MDVTRYWNYSANNALDFGLSGVMLRGSAISSIFKKNSNWPPDVKESYKLESSAIPGLFGQGSRTPNKTTNCDRTQ